LHTDHPRQSADASWAQLEQAIERLHAAARTPIGVRQFYARLLGEACDALAATGGAAWGARDGGRPELIAREATDPVDVEIFNRPAHREAVAAALDRGGAVIHTGPAEQEFDVLLCPVPRPAGAEPALHAAAVIELWMPAGASPPVRQGWLDFSSALADVAADFHAWDELRRLRAGATLRRQSIDLVRRVQGPRDFKSAAFEAANEARRLLNCNRVSVLVRRPGGWRLTAVSGVDRVEPRTELAHRSERLAQHVATWGEPVDYAAQRDPASASEASGGEPELPPPLLAAIEDYVDDSHARGLAAVPVAFAPRDDADDSRRRTRFDLVLVAERFDAGEPGALRSQLVEIGELCGPVLARAAQLDRPAVRALLNWSDRLAALRQPRRAVRAAWIVAAIGAVLAALAFVPCDFDVEAPARLAAAVERDVFAPASGAVAEVHVKHGQTVAQGDVLAVLSDPELALKLQETRGELASTRKRLEALAVARTDRTLREDGEKDRLPLSAEQRELEERQASLERQLALLTARSEALVLRSPHAGTVLTLDVQSLLESRPVERGQVLLTIADSSTGWELKADVPQRQIGHVLAAQQEQSAPLAATYRLAGDVTTTYPGHVAAVSAEAPLDADRLQDYVPPVEVRIAVDGEPPAAARSGMNANVRIHCGRRSLGYVWLHDAAATLYRWVTF